MNGEIGYIAVAETPTVVMAPAVDMTLQHLHTSTLVSPAHMAMAPNMAPNDHNMDIQTTTGAASSPFEL
jgi:hypothetical protein